MQEEVRPTSEPSPAEPDGPRHRVGLSSTGVFLISVFVQIIGVVSSVVVNRYIGSSESGKAIIGTVQLYLLIASSINGIGDLRIGTSYTYYIARGRSPRDLTATYLALRLAMMAIASIALFLLASTPGTGVRFASTAEEVETFGVFMVLPFLWSVQTVYTQLRIAQGRSTAGQMPLLLEVVIRTPLLVLVALPPALYPGAIHGLSALYDPTITGLTLAYVPGAIASAIYCVGPVARETVRFRWTEAVELFRYAWPLMGSLVLLYLVNNTPPLIVAAYKGAAYLAYFSAANGWRILALSLPAAVTVPLFPHLTSLNRSRGLSAVRRSTWSALRYTAMIVVPGVMAMVVYRDNLIFLFTNGTYVRAASTPLAILALSVIPAALAQIIGTALSAIGYQRLELYLTTAQVIALFGSVVVLLPPFGAGSLPALVAVSVAILASSLVALVLNAYFMFRLLAVHIQLRPIGSMLVSGAAAFLAVGQLNDALPINRGYQLAIGLALGFGVYFLVLAVIGELSKEDTRYLLTSLGLPKAVGTSLAKLCWRDVTPAVNEGIPSTNGFGPGFGGPGSQGPDPPAPGPPL